MTTVVLHGDLACFGGPYTFDAKTPLDVVSALCAQVKGFKKRFYNGAFRLIRRKGDRERDLDEKTLSAALLGGELHIVPVVEGAGNKGGGKAVLGAVIMAAAFLAAPAVSIPAIGLETGPLMGATAIEALGVTYSQIAGFGMTMLLGGIGQLLGGRTTSTAASTSVEQNASYVFDGPFNSSRQGVARPLVFGDFICSTVVVSSDLVAENILSGTTSTSGGSFGS